MKILIKITREILERSMYCQTEIGKTCAFALAFRELFPGAWIGYTQITPFYQDHIDREVYGVPQTIDMTEEMCRFIDAFDILKPYPKQRMKLPEQSFEIEIPDSVIEKIGIQEVNKILSESKTLERV